MLDHLPTGLGLEIDRSNHEPIQQGQRSGLVQDDLDQLGTGALDPFCRHRNGVEGSGSRGTAGPSTRPPAAPVSLTRSWTGCWNGSTGDPLSDESGPLSFRNRSTDARSRSTEYGNRSKTTSRAGRWPMPRESAHESRSTAVGRCSGLPAGRG